MKKNLIYAGILLVIVIVSCTVGIMYMNSLNTSNSEPLYTEKFINDKEYLEVNFNYDTSYIEKLRAKINEHKIDSKVFKEEDKETKSTVNGGEDIKNSEESKENASNSNSLIENNNEINNINDTIVENSNNNLNKVIVLDPGHANRSNLEKEQLAPGSSELKIKDGGGASGVSTGTTEQEINLNVAFKLKVLLESEGYKVVMTKTSQDESLGNIERAEVGNRENANLVLRIHCDSSNDNSVNGASMLVPVGINENTSKISGESERCGNIILNTLCNEVGMKNRGLIYSSDMTGFNWSKVPVVLVEMGFLSNSNEDILLSSDDYQNKIAASLCHGIKEVVK